MLGALQALRERRRAGAPIDVFFFDSEERLGPGRRDEGMAQAIAEERRRAPGDAWIVLVGNLHARKADGAPWDPKANVRWMAGFLAVKDADLVTLDLRAPAGAFWGCMMDTPAGPEVCGQTPWRGNLPAGGPRAVVLQAQPADGYDGIFVLPPLTPSPLAFAAPAAPATR